MHNLEIYPNTVNFYQEGHTSKIWPEGAIFQKFCQRAYFKNLARRGRFSKILPKGKFQKKILCRKGHITLFKTAMASHKPCMIGDCNLLLTH